MIFENFFIKDTDDLNWEYIMSIPEFSKLEECEQSPKWHGEGNALIHTKNCVKAAYSIINDMNIALPYERRLLIISVLFHDIGKGVTTEFKKGAWHAYGHEIEGEKITRRILWNESLLAREDVCALARWHMEPLRVFDRKDYIEEIIRLNYLSHSIDHLLFVKLCDIYGSTPEDKTQNEKDNEKLNTIAKIFKNFSSTSDIVTDRDIIFNKKFSWENNETYDSKVYMMIGLPGAGKNTYIEKNLPNILSLSRDDIRVELGYCKEGDKVRCSNEQEENVTKVFNERLLKVVEEKKDVILNDIHIKKKYRDNTYTLLNKYNVEWKYIYVEAPTIEDNIERRKDTISSDIIYKMAETLDWPRPFEYNTIKWAKQYAYGKD